LVKAINSWSVAMFLLSATITEATCRAVARRDNWGVYIHIFMFTYRKNNRFQKKSAGQNTNIWICTPRPPPPISGLATALATCTMHGIRDDGVVEGEWI
jgi:hypothetical protein